MDAKTRRVLKAKQSQQEVLDTSIAAVANKSKSEEVLIPKIWTINARMPSAAGNIVVIPSFIPLDNILSVEFVIDYGTAASNYKALVSFNDHSGHLFRPVIQLANRTITTGQLASTIQDKDVRITVFYI